MSVDIIDWTALRRLLDVIGGDPADLNDLLDDYRSIAPELAARIKSAAASGDLEALRIATHSLKSNARDFGAMRLSALCEELERDCRNGAVSDPNAAAAAIASAEADARQVLRNVTADGIRD